MKLENFIKGKGMLNLGITFFIVFLTGTYYELLSIITKLETIYSVKFFVVIFGASAFGLLTFIVIRNVEDKVLKICFSAFEFCAVMLHYQNWGTYQHLQFFIIVIFISVLCSAGVFTLAYISTEKDRREKEVSTELQDLQQSNSELTAELLNNQNELLNTQNELLDVTESLKEVTQSKEQVTQELLTQTSLLSEKSDYSAVKHALNESRGEIEKLLEYKTLWLAKVEADRITNIKRGQRKTQNEI